jgi:lipoprotein-anchoring transpeptidase ErfK/SrfK
MLKPWQKSHNNPLTTFLLFLLLACTLLLSSCSGITGASANTAATPTAQPTLTPTSAGPQINATLAQKGTTELETLQQWIASMKQHGGDVGKYQQQYDGDKQALSSATTNEAYQKALKTLQEHVNAIKLPALYTEATDLQEQLRKEATEWTNTHTYYNDYDGTTYNLGYEYLNVPNYPAQGLIDGSQTIVDYQYVIGELNSWLANFAAYKANYSDKTPYDQVHKTDTELLQRYGYTSGKVLVVSFSEQAMRVYENGQLIKSFLVVTGMPGNPSLPGVWWVQNRRTDMEFTSGKKEGEEGYYPPTPIAYAMLYHSGEYYIHESWWRTQYGPTKQFPHLDPGGTEFAQRGSHGCVNMSTEDVQWVYNYVNESRVLRVAGHSKTKFCFSLDLRTTIKKRLLLLRSHKGIV